jgi:hypothetical protein
MVVFMLNQGAGVVHLVSGYSTKELVCELLSNPYLCEGRRT